MAKNIKKTAGFLFVMVFCTIVATWMPQRAKAAEVAINETNFPDEIFRNYVIENFDTNKDHQLSDQEKQDVTTINIEWGGIKNLKGIEHFQTLTSLNCSANYLTALDISQNTALTDLDCSRNQLTALDVRNNTALKQLKCDINPLTALDVSQNTALTFLYCYSTQLTTLDISNNTALATLYCSDTQLTALDVSKNTALKCLLCYNNQLTDLNISKNTALTDLLCYGTKLTTLDISNNTALTSLHCSNTQLTALDISKNTALVTLNCSDTQLTALDISKNIALKNLDCSGIQLKALDISKNAALIVLNCSDTQMTVLDAGKNTALKNLECHSNHLTELKLNSQTYNTLPLYKGYLHDGTANLSDLQNVTETKIDDPDDPDDPNNFDKPDKVSLIKVTDITKPAIYKVNGKDFKIIYADSVTMPGVSPSTGSGVHIFSDYNYNSPVTDGSIVVYGNGMTKKINGKKVNNRVSIVYTDILASYKYTENNGAVKPSVGKVIVAVTKSAAKPTISNKNKVTDTSAAKMAKAKIKNGQITVTAAGKEGGLAYLWVIDTGNKGVSACCPVNVKLVPKKLEIQSTSGSKLAKNTEVKKGNTLDVCVTGSVGSTKAEAGTYTAAAIPKYNSYVTVTPVAGSTNKFTIAAKDLKNNKKTKVVVTFKCDQNNKKTNLSLVITK